tara:strand:- start:2978 stop:4606 length:1629 start_codon:yes stop_codon:yes gene_type:complete
MPQKFPGTVAEIKTFAAWAHKVANSTVAKWRDLRRILREESTPVPGARRTASPTFLAEMHRQFPSMAGCRTDISCLYQLFEAFVNKLDLNEKRLKKGMKAVNKILPLVYVTESQLGAYRTFTFTLTPLVKKKYGAKNFNKNFKNFLQPAGGSETAAAAYKYKVAAEEKAAEGLAYRQQHKIPVTEAAIITAIRKWGESDDLAELFLFAQILTGSRKSEIMNPNVSNFEHEESLVYGHLVQWGTSKEKGSDPELAVEPDEGENVEELKVDDNGAPPGFALRRRVEKPILRVLKNPLTLEIYTVADVLRAIRLVRAGWEVQAKLDQGGTNAEIASLHDNELAKVVRENFKDAAAYAAVHRTNQISTHFARKVYAGYGYKTLGDPTQSTFAGWASKYLGWKLSSGLGTSISYSDLEIILLPPKLEDIDETKLQIQALVSQFVPQPPQADEDMEDADLKTRILHGRGLKRSFIDITGDNEVQVRIPFNKRRRNGSSVARARESMRLLIATGVVPTKMMLRRMGYGGVAAKQAYDAGPAAAPDAADA